MVFAKFAVLPAANEIRLSEIARKPDLKYEKTGKCELLELTKSESLQRRIRKNYYY